METNKYYGRAYEWWNVCAAGSRQVVWFSCAVEFWGYNYCFLLGKEMVQNMVFIVEDSLKQGLIIQLAELTQLTKCWKVPGQELRPL